MQGRAHVGGHVTLIFSIQDDAENLIEQGSRGAGLSLDRGVIIVADATPGNGQLTLNNSKLNFDGGKGYIEKDWGRNFPKNWIWAQSNHFQESELSLSLIHIGRCRRRLRCRSRW